jgi:hypothetical protein
LEKKRSLSIPYGMLMTTTVHPSGIAVDGKDGSAVVFVDDAIDARSAVRAFDLVFAKAEPRILGV